MSTLLFRLRDIFISSFALILLFPVLALAALLLKLTMPGPVFFVQQRVGRNGQLFWIYKFRSMVINTEKNGITLSKDKRITSFGRVLRTTKVDELPQLFNILKGEMSLVGPRPDLPGYYDTLSGAYSQILSLRPGLTGLDSVFYPYEEKLLSGIDNPVEYYKSTLWPHKVRINYWYYQHQSHRLDLKIMINTLTILLFSKTIFPLPNIE